MMKIVATTSLPAVDRQNADRWNAARSCQNQDTRRKKTFLQLWDSFYVWAPQLDQDQNSLPPHTLKIQVLFWLSASA